MWESALEPLKASGGWYIYSQTLVLLLLPNIALLTVPSVAYFVYFKK